MRLDRKRSSLCLLEPGAISWRRPGMHKATY